MFLVMRVGVAAAVIVMALAIGSRPFWVTAQEGIPVLRCFHHGEVLVASPLPTPEDFRAMLGEVTHAQWTLGSGQRQVVASTAPCVYLVTAPVPGSREAAEE